MNMKDLLIFQTAARLGTINGAAEELNYAQSNITSRIKKLENDLGVTLFVRHQRGIDLTDEGNIMLPYAQKILVLSEELTNAVQKEQAATGKLNIASVETVIHLPVILSTFIQDHPLVDLTLTTGVTKELIELVKHSKINGAFVTKGEWTADAALEKVDVFKEKLVLISAAHINSFEQAINLPLLRFSDGCGYRDKLNEWLKDFDIQPKKVMELGTLETTLGSVISGLGTAYVPYAAVKPYEKKGQIHCYNLPEAYSHITTVFVYRKQDYLSPALRSFLQTIEQTKTVTS